MFSGSCSGNATDSRPVRAVRKPGRQHRLGAYVVVSLACTSTCLAAHQALRRYASRGIMLVIEDQIITPPVGIMPVMQMVEAQRASILVSHDHLHDNQMRTLVERSKRYRRATGNDRRQAATAAGLPERITPMTEDERSIYGMVPRLVQEYIGQLRGIAEKLEDRSGLSGALPLAHGALPLASALPLPGALSAAQTKSITDSIAAQRRSIAALRAQLSSYDEQLAALEQILGPLSEWSRTWADLEQRLLNVGRRPEGGR